MDVLEILNKIGYTSLSDSGKNWRTRPLYRSSSNSTSLCIDKHSGFWHDFGTNQGGALAQLVRKTLDLKTIDEAVKIMGQDLVAQEEDKNQVYYCPQQKTWDKNLLLALKKNHSYWINRGVSKETMELFQGGVTNNKGRMAYRYVFPIFNDRDDIVGFAGRSLNDNPDFPKWMLLGRKKEWIYPLKLNFNIIDSLKEVVIVESIGDMLALWGAGVKNVLVAFGISISPKIIQMLIKLDVRRILIAFNNDKDNNLIGNNAAIQARFNLLSYFDAEQVSIAIPDQKDFGVMTVEQINLWKNKNQIKS